MYTIGVVILHYKNRYETEKCVESYLKQDCKRVTAKIVIVDNGSQNGTGKMLQEKYKKSNSIYVLVLDKNLGFAQGNNTGMRFLMTKCIPDFVVYSNSDIELINDQFYHWIITDYEKFNFAVLGPDIYSTTKRFHQSPTPNFSYRRAIERKYFNFPLYMRIRDKLFPTKIDYTGISSQYTLHGALLVFSERFFKIYPDGIYDKTFLYLEEAFLRKYCDKAGLPMIYDGTYKVYHVQAASTDNDWSLEKEKQRLRENRFNESLNLYLKLSKTECGRKH